MGHRPTDWHVLDLEGDPTPGDPDRVRQLARELHDFAEDVGNALRQIGNMSGEDAIQKWSGKSARKFKEQFDGVPGNLKKLRTSYDMAGDAIAAYWPHLERAQALSARALAKAREARAELDAAKGRLDSANDWVKTASAKTKAYDDAKGPEAPDEAKVRAAARSAHQAASARSDAQGAVDSAQSTLDAAKAMAQEARELREDAARTCKDKLDEASDAGIQNRNWWEDAVHFVTENWDTIVAVCKVVVAVVGVVAMIIGGPILAAIVVVAALVVLADTLHKYANGKASLFDVGMAALDCIPGVKGLTTLAGAAAGIKAMSKGLRSGGLRNGLKNLVSKSKPAAGRCKGGDPIDMVSGEMLMEDTDVELPGVLPLFLRRTHLSTYRWGRVFGESWASTLDQRLELDEEGAVFATEDGMLLSYPVPQPGHPVMPEAGPRWPLEWDGTSNGAITITDPRSGLTRHFAPQPTIPKQRSHRDAPESVTLLLRSINDRNGNEITFEYDAAGMPAAVRHTGGYHIAIDTTGDRITGLRLITSDGESEGIRILRYGYDAAGNLAEIYRSSGQPLRLAYDAAARITSWTDRIGAWYRYTYDAEDRVVQGEGVDGILSCTVAYDPDNHITRYQNSLGQVTTYEYNDRLQLVAETDPLGHTMRQQWGEQEQLLSQTDALGNTISYAYDAAGNVNCLTHADGSSVTITHNNFGLPTESVDADGAIWRREYDTCGNLTAVTDPTGVSTHFSYSSTGHLSAITDALGNATRVECDPAGLPISVIDPLGAVTRYTRNAFGLPTTVTDPMGAVTNLEWTPEGRIALQRNPDGAVKVWTYDGEGNCISHTDALGQTSTYEYTHFDLLAARTDSDGTRHTFTHDRERRLCEVANPQGLTWSYSYDPAGRLTAETDFDDRTITYTHDAASRTTTHTTPLGDVISYTYDEVGNITTKDAAGDVSRFAYDAVGRLRQAENAGHELVLAYDAAGRLTEETANGRTVTHAHDALGRPTQRLTPTGATTRYRYDAAGHRIELATATGHTLASTRDSVGRELLRTLDDGTLTIAHTWAPTGRLAQQHLVTRTGTLRTRDYRYRADGYLIGTADSRTGENHYTLDPAGRITGVSAHDWSESYAYDATGNQTAAHWSDTHPGTQDRGERTYTGTRIIGAGANRYEHDAAGRLTLRQKTRLSRKPDTWHYTWNAENQLTEVTTPDGTRWRYAYDPLGRRSSKERLALDGTVAEQVHFTWDGPVLIEETTTAQDEPHPVTLTWDHEGFRPIGQTERRLDAATQEEIDARFFAIATDLVGTPTELIGTDGDIAAHSRTTVWGTTSWSTTSTAYTPLRFPGQYFDPETGLHYNHHRYYDPTTARYLTPDPLGLAPAPNPVTYVHNPHSWTDPLGLSPEGCPEVFYRAMSKKEFDRLGPNGEITPRGENFVTQNRGYVERLADTFARRGGRKADAYTHLVRYEMEPGTRDALIAAGRGSGDNMREISARYGIQLEEIGTDVNSVHVKLERDDLNFGLRSGSADVFNSRILGMSHTPL